MQKYILRQVLDALNIYKNLNNAKFASAWISRRKSASTQTEAAKLGQRFFIPSPCLGYVCYVCIQ